MTTTLGDFGNRTRRNSRVISPTSGRIAILALHCQALGGIHEGRDGLAGLPEEPLVNLVGLIKAIIALSGITIESEVGIVVNEGAKDVLAIPSVSPGVEDVLMPKHVNDIVRHCIEVRDANDNLEKTQVPLLRLIGLYLCPTLTFWGWFSEFALDVIKIKLFKSL